MKLGFIFECGPQGGDAKVFQHLCAKICASLALPFDPKTDFDFEPLDNKPKLVGDCGKAAKRLIDSGCGIVFVVWDLFPAWREHGAKPCRHEDKVAITASLATYALVPADVVFLCIEEELEAWLIADGRALSNYFSKPHRQVSIKNETKPDKVRDPKGRLTGYFKNHKGGLYDGSQHAEKIVRQIDDFQKLKKSESFCRFYEKLTGRNL